MRLKLGLDADLVALWRGAGTVFAIRALGGALLYLVQIRVAQWLGAEQFGLFSYAWSWATLLAVLATLGLPNSSLRFIPEYRARSQGRALRRFVRWAWSMAAASGIGVMLVAWLALRAGESMIQPGHRSVLYVAFTAIPILAVSFVQVQMARALDHIVLAFAPVQVVRPLLFIVFGAVAGAVVAAPSAELFIGLMTAAFTIVTAAQALALLEIVRAQSRALAATLAGPGDGHRHWLRASLPMLVFSGAQIALSESGIIMVGVFLSPEEVAIYTAAARTALLLTMVTMAIDTITVPKIAALHARGQRQEIRHVLRATIRSAFLLSAAMMLFLIVGGKLILGLFGSAFVDGYGALVILAVGLALSAAVAPVPLILNVTGHQDVVTWASLVLVGLNVLLGFVLIPPFGVLGAAITTAVVTVLLRASLLGVLYRRLGAVAVIAPLGWAARVVQRHNS